MRKLLTKRRIALVGLVGLFVFMAVNCRIIAHNQHMAADTAQRFAEAAFLNKDFDAALAFLDQGLRAEMPPERLSDLLKAMHPKSYPDDVKATEYEPIFGQKAMYVFLVGFKDEEAFYYRFLMFGTRETGYRVAGFFRGSGPYPPSGSRNPLR